MTQSLANIKTHLISAGNTLNDSTFDGHTAITWNSGICNIHLYEEDGDVLCATLTRNNQLDSHWKLLRTLSLEDIEIQFNLWKSVV